MVNSVVTNAPTLENKFNIGEPVAVCAWVKGIQLMEGKLEYILEFKADDDTQLITLTDVPEYLITTVFEG